MIRVTAPGRAEVVDGEDAAALAIELDRAFGGTGVRTVAWWVPVGDWTTRRRAWQLGFSYGGVLRGWLPSGDAWAFTLGPDDPREPRIAWLECPVAERDGVRLRPLAPRDAPRVAEGLADAEAQYWLGFLPRKIGEAEGRAYVETGRERLATNHTVTWAFTSTEDDLLLGVVGLFRLEHAPELGYWTHPDARGRRLTTRAAALAVDHAFEVLELPVLLGFVAAGNEASMGVLERLGMRRLGLLRHLARTGDGALVDLVGYDLLASEWAERRWSEAESTSTAIPTTVSAAPTSAGAR